MVGENKTDMLRRMTRSVHHFQGQVSNLDDIAVAHHHVVLRGELILPVPPAFFGEIQLGTRFVSQLPGAGQKIGVNVSLSRADDLQSLRCGISKIRAYVPPRVYHDRHAAGLTTY